MSKPIRNLASLATALLTAASLVLAAEPAANSKWIPSYATAMKTAKAANKPVLLVFYTTWCTFCAKMHHKTLDAPELQPVLEQYVTTMVDAEVDLVAAKRFRPVGFPVVVVIDPAGREVVRFMGYQEPEAFTVAMKALTAKLPEFSTLAADIEKKATTDNELQLGDFYAGTGFPSEALEQYQKALKLAGKKPSPLRESLLARAGEAARIGGEPKDAKGYYDELLKEYPKSASVPLALFGLAELAAADGKLDVAKNGWQKIVTEYASSPQAAEASKRLGS